MEKYCIFSAQYLPAIGGVEQYTENLANCLIERGHEVIIITAKKKDTRMKERKKNGLLIYRLPTLQLVSGRMPITYYSATWKKLKEILKKKNITRVIIQTRLYTLSIIGLRYAKKNHIPAIVIEHGTSYVGMSNRFLQFFEIMYERILLFGAKRYCHTFCSVSKEGSRWLGTLGIKCSGILYNSVDEKKIEQYLVMEKKNEVLNNRLSLEKLSVTFVGRLIKEKGLIQLVQAVEELNSEGIDIELRIIGDGPLYKEIEAKNVANVILLGRLQQAEVMSVLKNSDIFCLPSDSEGFPTSVLEAILCGTYVITAPYGGAKEIISSEEYGDVMLDNTSESIKKSIKNAVSLGERRHIIEQNVYQRFMKEFTWDKTCDVLETLQWEAVK